MSEPFDPYRKWLGIPLKDQPPNHYRLLGIAHFEDDPDVIENAATRQMAHVRTFQAGKHSALSQKVLNELTAAKLCLLNADKKGVYDEWLRSSLAAEGKLSSDNMLIPSELASEGDAEDGRDGGNEWPRTADVRWKTESDEPSPISPPIVPIPIPAGSVVFAPPRLAPSLPLPASPLVVSPSRSSYRAKKSSSAAIPLAVGIVGLLVILGGGIAVLVYSGALSRPLEKGTHKRTSPAPTHFPVGTAVKETKVRGKVEPAPRLQPAPPAREENKSANDGLPSPPAKAAAPPGSLADQLRQAEYLGRAALKERNSDECKRQLATAENLIDGNPAVESKLKEQIQHLRDLYTLNAKFWMLVREAAIDGRLQAGEKFQFRKTDYILEGHEGEQVTYKIGETQQVRPLLEMDGSAALALVWQSTKENQAERLCMVAFAAVDERGEGGKTRHELAKRLYEHLAVQGHTHAGLAKELGVPEKPDPEKAKDVAKEFE